MLRGRPALTARSLARDLHVVDGLLGAPVCSHSSALVGEDHPATRSLGRGRALIHPPRRVRFLYAFVSAPKARLRLSAVSVPAATAFWDLSRPRISRRPVPRLPGVSSWGAGLEGVTTALGDLPTATASACLTALGARVWLVCLCLCPGVMEHMHGS